MIIDAHIHLFTPAIVENVAQRPGITAELHLEAQAAPHRLTTDALNAALQAAGVDLALHLPTASAEGVSKVNQRAMALANTQPRIATAGTLHPRNPDTPHQLAALHAEGVRAIKLCSFSQGFQLDGGAAKAMFAQIEHFNTQCQTPFLVVLDTYFKADEHFGCAPEHVTTPARITDLVRRYPNINFVGAHMGGLSAPEDLLIGGLPAAPNLYLDTSNAAHTLTAETFCELLRIHGPEHILFGTDWPWFGARDEIPRIDGLLKQAGLSAPDRAMVFGENAARLLK